MRPAGLSIAELLVVALVMATAGLVVVGRSTSVNDEVRIDLATSEVAAALRFARSEAVRSGQYHGARIDSAQQRIRVYRLDVSGFPAVEEYVVAHPVDKQLFDIRLRSRSFTPDGGITSVEFRFGGDSTPRASVAFDARGTPVSPLDLTLMDSGRVTFGLDGLLATVSIAPLSGLVRTQ